MLWIWHILSKILFRLLLSLRGSVLLFGALLVGCIVIFAWCVEPLMFGVELAGLLEDPTFSVGMIFRFIGGAMDLTYLVQNFV